MRNVREMRPIKNRPFRSLILGGEETWIRRVVAIACCLAAFGALVNYARMTLFINGNDVPWLLTQIDLALGLESPFGALLVLCLTTASAYLYAGLVPTFLLGISVRLGDSMVYFSEFPSIVEQPPDPSAYAIAVGFTPDFLIQYPPTLLIAIIIGFALGTVVRRNFKLRS